jgi:hypothetical protein
MLEGSENKGSNCWPRVLGSYKLFFMPDINLLFNFKELFVSTRITADKGGRRLGIDRRQFSYYFHIPERRSGIDRRSGVDRRRERYRNRGDIERRENLLLLV